jgi:hypothetical protein
MSTWFEEQVTCPHCGVEQLARLAHGVHVARAPEVRDQLFARTFHAIECRACHQVFIAQRPLIYTDIERKHWIQVALEIERPRWPELESAVEAIYERAFTGSPLARELSERMRVRLVFSLEELREKLVIWDANLDDAAMECLKLDLIAREPALAHARVTVDSVAADHGIVLRVDGSRSISVDGTRVEQFDADRRLEKRFPELFGGRYVAFIRLTGHRYRWVEPVPRS